MNNLILIKYGELTTKGDNLKVFINTLYNYLKNKLKNIETNIIKERGRMYIEFNELDLDTVKKVLSNTFGII
jgi:Thiamine biosynthesis ATP pyrophosphatase